MAARLVKQQVLPKEDLIFFFFFFFILKKRPQKSGVADRAGKDYRKKKWWGEGRKGWSPEIHFLELWLPISDAPKSLVSPNPGLDGKAQGRFS